jgi:hypothetical protein
MERRSPNRSIQSALLIGMSLLLLSLMYDRNPLGRWIAEPSPQCRSTPNPDRALSRQQLAQLLNLSEDQSRAQIQTLLDTPYCQLAIANPGGMEEDAYRLAFDPYPWLVVQYRGDRYMGYRFHFP